ncbi:hypothetical protein BVRB_1g008090 [Beta vulgaris subsp. vulgaris]|nr:hypothetical protein BVRB_1g008090 [Beta vulgaris subsp. vulgaris]
MKTAKDEGSVEIRCIRRRGLMKTSDGRTTASSWLVQSVETLFVAIRALQVFVAELGGGRREKEGERRTKG